MSEFYRSLESTAQRLIAQFGQSAKLIKRTQHKPEPWNPVITEEEFAVNLVQSSESQSYRNETTVQEGDVFFIIATGVVPEVGDGVRTKRRYTIVDVKPLSPAGIDLYYDVQARA